MNNEVEVWKTYPKIEWLQGSDLGNVRTLDHYVMCKDGRKQFVKGHVLPQWHRKDGYMDVKISVNGKKISLKVHRVIASCFLPNPNNLPQVNHIDCDRTNNHVSNLEWCDGSYNNRYREKYGISQTEAIGHRIIAINLKTLEALYFKSQHEAARQLGASNGNINKVIKGQRKTTKGYWFVNADESAVEAVRAKFGNNVANKVSALADKKGELE